MVNNWGKDALAAFANCKAAQKAGQEIDDATARVIANWWHAGQGSLGYSFVSTGAITDPTDVYRDLLQDPNDYTNAGPDDKLALDMLGTYLMKAGKRGPVDGWSTLWVR